MRRPPLARLRVAAALALALALAATGCSRDDPELGPNPAGKTTGAGAGAGAGGLPTVTAGRLTVCTHIPHVPFEFEDAGQLDGIGIELIRVLAGRLALAPVFVQVDTAGPAGALADALVARRCDVAAASLTVTTPGIEDVAVSSPYFRVDQSLLVRRDDQAAYTELQALAGRPVGVVASTTGAAGAATLVAGATVREFAGADALLAALMASEVEAALQDHPANAYHATTTGATAVVRTFDQGERPEYVLALRKGDAALKTAVDDAIARVRSDDTYGTILRHFLGDTAGQV